LGDDLVVEAAAEQQEGEPFVRLRLVVDNRRRYHRLRLVVPTEGAGGAWAGVAFGAVHRPLRPRGSERGREYDLPTDPARGWVTAGGTAVLLGGPFEYELAPQSLSVTLLRCVGDLSRPDLSNRPRHAGPGLATPGAQMRGRHHFELGIPRHQGGWLDSSLPRWAEVFALPLVPAPTGLAPGPGWEDPARMLSALRRLDGRVQLRTYSLTDFRVDQRWLDGEWKH
jgi:alpha-mannosidase